jgi:glycosidase
MAMKKFVLMALVLGMMSCGQQPKTETEEVMVEEKVESRHPEWVKSANIYEVNVRQYSKEGTFAAFAAHLPRLKEMGVDILWFMPIQPIGVENRKIVGDQNLGSYYSISDYTAIHPDYGTEEEFKALVEQAHSMGMHIILDWVANHTSFDHHWTKEHPDFYSHDKDGNINVALDLEGKPTDWTDVADLDYSNTELREAMFQEMAWWVREFNIDGFRCDVAGFVPNDFWDDLRPKLEEIKPLFMLAEWEDPAHMKIAFNMNYGWEYHHLINQIAQEKHGVEILDTYMAKVDTLYSRDDIRMYFTTNHDENSWNGTVFERLGDQHLNMFLLSATLPGMPLIYSGQEAGLNHRLSFFGKDEIDWSSKELLPFYTKVLALKHDNSALWNGNWGGEFKRINTSEEGVYSYSRIGKENEVVVYLNLGSEDHIIDLTALGSLDEYTDHPFGDGVSITEGKLTLPAACAFILTK